MGSVLAVASREVFRARSSTPYRPPLGRDRKVNHARPTRLSEFEPPPDLRPAQSAGVYQMGEV